jgi:hypothetical protein
MVKWMCEEDKRETSGDDHQGLPLFSLGWVLIIYKKVSKNNNMQNDGSMNAWF